MHSVVEQKKCIVLFVISSLTSCSVIAIDNYLCSQHSQRPREKNKSYSLGASKSTNKSENGWREPVSRMESQVSPHASKSLYVVFKLLDNYFHRS